MKYVLGLDFETTFHDPVDPKISRIVEIGAVLWEPRTQTPDLLMSRLVWDAADPGYVYDPRMHDLCGIAEEPLLKFGIHPKQAIQNLLVMIDQAEAVVAHNGIGFDRVVLEHECARHGLQMPTKQWIDTTVDVPYPKSIETRKLKFLCGEHGFLNPYSHRALFDVLAMLRVMGCYDFDSVLARSLQPNVTVRAHVPKPFGPGNDGGAGVAAAKARGFRWNGDKKWWVKMLKGPEISAEAEAMAPYRIEQVEI